MVTKKQRATYLVNFRLPWICLYIYNIDSVAKNTRGNQTIPRSFRIVMATGASIPSSVMKLLGKMQCMSSVYDLKVVKYRKTMFLVSSQLLKCFRLILYRL